MKILVISDKASDYLWGPCLKSAVKGVDLILSCGDLPKAYMEYVVTISNLPLYYVHGNHDKGDPEGCICIDDKLVTVNGIRILGLGGSIRYCKDSQYQYTQRQMQSRARKLAFSIYRKKGFDILLTHSGASGLGDDEDYAHTGFTAFNRLIDRWQPAYFIHGHTHLTYNWKHARTEMYGQTTVINGYERYIFDFEPVNTGST